MSLNKITFGEKELCGKNFNKINLCFSNGDNFDVILNKKNGKTYLIFERSYIRNLLKFGFMNGGAEADPGMTEMLINMVEMIFLPVIGVFNVTELKFDEIYAGSIKANLSNKIPTSFGNKSETETNNTTTEQSTDPPENQNFMSNMMSNLGQVWQKDFDEVNEEEELDDFLIDNSTTDKNKIQSINTAENKLVINSSIDNNVILFNFELKINNYEELINKINSKNPEEIFKSAKEETINNFKMGDIQGVDNIELCGEDENCIKISLMHGGEKKEYMYNVYDSILIKESILKLLNYMKDDDYVLF
jgi:hypothetical protein